MYIYIYIYIYVCIYVYLYIHAYIYMRRLLAASMCDSPHTTHLNHKTPCTTATEKVGLTPPPSYLPPGMGRLCVTIVSHPMS